MMRSSGPVHIAVCRWLWSSTGFFGKLVLNIQTATLVHTSCIPCVGRCSWIGFSICGLSIVIRPDFDVTTTTSYSVFTVTWMNLASRIDACPFFASKGSSNDNIEVTSASVPLSSIATGSQWSGTILCSMGSITRVHLLIYVVTTNSFTDRFWTTLSEVRACRASICRQVGPHLSSTHLSFCSS